MNINNIDTFEIPCASVCDYDDVITLMLEELNSDTDSICLVGNGDITSYVFNEFSDFDYDILHMADIDGSIDTMYIFTLINGTISLSEFTGIYCLSNFKKVFVSVEHTELETIQDLIYTYDNIMLFTLGLDLSTIYTKNNSKDIQRIITAMEYINSLKL